MPGPLTTSDNNNDSKCDGIKLSSAPETEKLTGGDSKPKKPVNSRSTFSIFGLLQPLSVAWHVYSIPILTSTFLLCCAFPPFWPAILVYLVSVMFLLLPLLFGNGVITLVTLLSNLHVQIYMVYDKSPENGAVASRKLSWMTDNVFWDAFAEFFPINVYKTAELAPAFIEDDGSKEEDDRVNTDDEKKVALDKLGDAIDIDEETRSEVSTVVFSDDEETEKAPLEPEAVTDIDQTDDEQDLENRDSNFHRASDNEQVSVPTEADFLQSTQTFAGERSGFFSRLFRRRREAGLARTKRTGTQYIFGYHPHGIIGMGALGGLANGGAYFPSLFPGIPISLLTIANQFLVPLYREYLLALGLACVSKLSCTSLLSRGHSIVIVVGGAQESLLARPGSLDLVLSKRKGFVKIAMSVAGTCLVPVMAFGENDLYDQVQSDSKSRFYRFQTWLKNNIGFTLPLMHARGIFTHDFGIIPYRRPIHIVVGAPIPVPHILDPSQEQVDFYHRKYVDALQKLVTKYAPKFHRDHIGDNEACEYQHLNIVA